MSNFKGISKYSTKHQAKRKPALKVKKQELYFVYSPSQPERVSLFMDEFGYAPFIISKNASAYHNKNHHVPQNIEVIIIPVEEVSKALIQDEWEDFCDGGSESLQIGKLKQ